MGSLRFSDDTDSPSIVLQPPPNIHSYYASAHSHYIPHHHQHSKAATQSTTASHAPAGPSRKRSREENSDDTTPIHFKLPRTAEHAQCEYGTLGSLTGGSEATVEGQVHSEETVHEPDLDVEMTDDGATNTLSSTPDDGIGMSVTQGSLFSSQNVEGSDVFNRFIMMPPPIRRWVL
ncbi:MAG: hypothetical protein Q9213_004224 [Squamulea squamosa]